MINKKGFTLVEILATIVILGLLVTLGYISVRAILDRGNDSYYKTQEDMLILAGKNYFADYRSKLPKEIGETAYVTLKTLIDENYIEPIKDKNKNDCDDNKSRVTALKVSETEYQYYGLLVCDGYRTTSDETDPVIKFTPNKASSQERITVTMKVTDNEGISQYRYVVTKDGVLQRDSGYINYSGDITFNLKEIGVYEITGYARDTSNNLGTGKSGKYSIYDTINCEEVSISSDMKIDTWYNKDINVNISVPKNTYRYETSISKNGGDYELVNAYIGSTSSSVLLSEDGIYNIKVEVFDADGKSCASTTNGVYKVDKTAPTLDVELKKKSNSTNLNDSSNITSLATYTNDTWYNGYVVSRGSCSDNSNECTVSYKVTGASSSTNGFKVGTTRNINAEGTTTVEYKATDKAGNSTTKTYTVKLDRTRPTISYSVAGGTYAQSSLRVCATAKDNIGINSMRMEIAGTNPYYTEEDTTNSMCPTLSGYGTYTIYTKVFDVASNKQSKNPENPYGFYYQTYTLKSPKSVTVLNNSYFICPSDQERPSAAQCLTELYDSLYITNVYAIGTKVTFTASVRINKWDCTCSSAHEDRILCVANTNNVCVQELHRFDVGCLSNWCNGWNSYSGSLKTIGTFTVDTSTWSAGDYRITLEGATDKLRFKNTSGMKNTFRVTG